MDMLERVKAFNLQWVLNGFRMASNANNVLATVSIRESEWEEVGNWLWANKASYNGLSVLPYDSGNFKQPPFWGYLGSTLSGVGDFPSEYQPVGRVRT